MATVYNFSATQGSQLSVRLNVKDASGDAINLSGYSSRGVVKYRYSSTNTLVDLDPTIVSGNDRERLCKWFNRRLFKRISDFRSSYWRFCLRYRKISQRSL